MRNRACECARTQAFARAINTAHAFSIHYDEEPALHGVGILTLAAIKTRAAFSFFFFCASLVFRACRRGVVWVGVAGMWWGGVGVGV